MTAPRRRGALALLLLAACACEAAKSSLWGGKKPDEPDALRGSAAQPRAFFALGDNPLAWDDDVLSRATAADAHPRVRGAAEAQLFHLAGNVAAHLGLRPVDGLHLPTPVNFLFIGFARDGHRNVSLSEAELARWVDHMDHVLPHVRLPGAPPPPVGGVAAAEAAAGVALVEAEEEDEAPLFYGESYVSYNFSVHAVEFGPAVAAVFHRAIATLARPVDPAAAEAAGVPEGPAPFAPRVWYHVDSGAMTALLESLLAEVGLDGVAYNVALLNPSREGLPHRYGYRAGFSGPELAQLGAQWETHGMEAAVRAAGRGAPHPTLEALLRQAPAAPGSRRWRPPRNGAKFSFSRRIWEADAWARRAGAALDVVAAFRAGLSPSAVLRAEAAAALAGDADTPAARALRRALARGGAGGAHPDCLADTAAARGRAAFADLSAGPLGWGPARGGGTGLRRGALVDALFSGPSGAAAAAASAPPPEELEAALDDIAAARLGESDDDEVDELALLETELDVYEAFAQAHCATAPKGRVPPLCAELRTRVAAMEEELADLIAAEGREKGAAQPRQRKPRAHGWSIFEGDPHIGGAVSLARDRFLTELVALLSGSLRHFAAPAAFPGAYRYHRVVRVNLYDVLLRDVSAVSSPGALRGSVAAPRFDAEAFREAAQALMLPGQTLQLSAQVLDAAEDAALGAGIAAALRTASTPEAHPDVDGVVVAAHRYLDAAELRRQLADAHHRRRASARGRHVADEDAGSAGSSVLEVPVFVITAEGGPPLYVDPLERTTAVSLPELVVAVASPHARQLGPVACAEGPLLRDLSDAVAPAVAALAAHLGGAAPLHASAAPGGDDYTWAAGAHPLAATASSGAGGGAAAVADAVHRGYVVTALDASIADANAGIAALAALRSSDAAWQAYRRARGGAAAALTAWDALVAAWHDVADAASALDYGAAAEAGVAAERAGARFKAGAEALAEAMRPARCGAEARPLRVPWQALTLALMLLAAAAAAVHLLRPRRFKPKLN